MPKFDVKKYLTFSLKDYDKTKSKWQSYQPRTISWASIMQALESEYTILDDVDLWDIIESRNYYAHALLQNQYNLKPRSLAKSIHTLINALAFQYNLHTFKNMDLDLTDSQARSCAIRFYVENYAQVNARLTILMTEALKQTPFASLYFPE